MEHQGSVWVSFWERFGRNCPIFLVPILIYLGRCKAACAMQGSVHGRCLELLGSSGEQLGSVWGAYEGLLGSVWEAFGERLGRCKATFDACALQGSVHGRRLELLGSV